MSYKNDICEQASKIISGERQGQYGAPENSFAVIADLWNGYLRTDRGLTPGDVANMMALMKIARISNGVFKEDSYVDAIGYLAIGAELNKVDEAIENWRRHQKECSDSCGIDNPFRDPDSVDETEEENKIEDCYHCFYFNKKYDGCLKGNHAIKDIGCNGFKDKTSCLTCIHRNGSEPINDVLTNELRVLCNIDDEYHLNSKACKNWEEGEV